LGEPKRGLSFGLGDAVGLGKMRSGLSAIVYTPILLPENRIRHCSND